MRISAALCIVTGLAIAAFLGLAPGDTGTYEILEYGITLTPDETGRTEISYHQKWKVTGGEIPWITVGTANSNFSIVKGALSRNATRIRKSGGGGWSGVRITLDRAYVAGEVFEVGFAIEQRGLFHRHERGYRLHFVPGWYDRASIGALRVTLAFFTDLEGASADPEPDIGEARTLVWERSDLARGTKVPIGIVFPSRLFPGPLQLEQPVANPMGGRFGKKSRNADIAVFVVLIAVIPVIVIIVFAARSAKRTQRYGGGGRVGVGGSPAAFTRGCVISCACACVACACACACAGGGAAGCDRKSTASCPLCAACNNVKCPLHRGHSVSPPPVIRGSDR